MNQKQDVIVVGGGIAGLAAAALLANGGKTVLLLEQSGSPGGRAKTRVRDGFHFNLGAHALYRGGPAQSVLSELGVSYTGSAPPLSGQMALMNGSLHTFPSATLSLLTTDLFGLPSKLETARLLGSVSKIRTDDILDTPLAEWVESRATHSDVRNLLLSVCRLTTYANSPERISAGCAIKQLQMALSNGVLYLDGGWQTLVEGLRQAAEREGVVIRTGARVDSIERNRAGGAIGVRLATGDVVRADSVLIAASPSVASALLGSGVAGNTKWDAAIPVRAASMDVALKNLPRPRNLFVLGIDKPLYFSVHSASARLAPAGAALAHMIWYLAEDEAARPDTIKAEFEQLLDKAQPGWRDLVIHSEFLPELIVANALPEARTHGIMGWPGPAVAEVPGLFLAGDWVGGGGVLADAALGSARQAARLIAGRPTVSADVIPAMTADVTAAVG